MNCSVGEYMPVTEHRLYLCFRAAGHLAQLPEHLPAVGLLALIKHPVSQCMLKCIMLCLAIESCFPALRARTACVCVLLVLLGSVEM